MGLHFLFSLSNLYLLSSESYLFLVTTSATAKLKSSRAYVLESHIKGENSVYCPACGVLVDTWFP